MKEEEVKGAAGQDRRGMVFDDALASKMFHGALQPVRISPYHWTGERTPGKEEVTVTTHITPDRLEVFMKLVGRNLGPVSCTLHIDDDENADRIIDVVNTIRSSSPLFRKNVDIHVVRDKFGRQYNLWRNLARFFARTDYYLLLDVDFSVRTDIQKALRLALHSPSSPIAETLASGEAALVLPAFEYAEDATEPELPDPNSFEPGIPETIRRLAEESGVVLSAEPPHTSQRNKERKEHYNDVTPEDRHFPTNKKSLVRQVDSGRITMFHAKWRRGHGPTDYARWHESTEPYVVKEYEPAYEPYVIVRKDAVPWCEERFVGYGANKAACIMQMYMSGVSFWVSPDAFVMHQSHGYPELNRRSERPHNRRLYERFFHENCFRGARQFVSAGLWNTPRAFNLRRECGKKVKRFEEQLEQYFDTS